MADEFQPGVTDDELDLSLLTPRRRTLKLEVPVLDSTGRSVAIELRPFVVRGDLDIDRMDEFLILERRINEALAAMSDLVDLDKNDPKLAEGEKKASRDFHDVLSATCASIRDVLLELNPPETVPAKLRLSEAQVLKTLAWLAGNPDSVAGAVAEALTAGLSGAKTADEVDGDQEADAERAADAGQVAGPLPLSAP